MEYLIKWVHNKMFVTQRASLQMRYSRFIIFMEEVLPSDDVEKEAEQGLQGISIDTQEYMPPID